MIKDLLGSLIKKLTLFMTYKIKWYLGNKEKYIYSVYYVFR